MKQNREKTDGWVVAAMATPDVTHPRGLWAGHEPRSAEAPSFVSLSVYACAVGVESGGRGLRQEELGSLQEGEWGRKSCAGGAGVARGQEGPRSGVYDRAQGP